MGEQYPGGIPPTWRMTVRRVPKDDASWLIYHEFVPSPTVREVVLADEGSQRR